MRIVQISDTHLSRDKPHFVNNWVPLSAWIADQQPDLVIHTGDVTADGAGVEADLSFSAHLMDELRIRWRAVPGNHDVGEARHARQPVNAGRLRAWQRHFGPDRWVEDVAGGAQRWRLVGLDVMLVGSGEPEEDEQALWLEQVMAEAGERRIAWFLHRPLFLEDLGGRRHRLLVGQAAAARSASGAGAAAPGCPRRQRTSAQSARFRLRGHALYLVAGFELSGRRAATRDAG